MSCFSKGMARSERWGQRTKFWCKQTLFQLDLQLHVLSRVHLNISAPGWVKRGCDGLRRGDDQQLRDTPRTTGALL